MPASFSSHPIKLIDIARKAGVTPAVVSHVLNNRQSIIRVSAQKREAILAIAKKMEYLPDINARALRGGVMENYKVKESTSYDKFLDEDYG